jgi:hypothetical protein
VYEREREREMYNDPLEVDNGFVSLLVIAENSICKQRNIISRITFSRNIKGPVLVLGKSLKPIH